MNENPSEVAEALWALSNLAAHDDLIANVLIQDDVFETVTNLLRSTKI